MAITNATDNLGDWTLITVSNNDAIKQTIITRLREWKNDCFFNVNAGIAWQQTTGINFLEERKRDITNIIASTSGVTKVIEVQFDFSNRKFKVSYVVETILSQSNISNNITILM